MARLRALIIVAVLVVSAGILVSVAIVKDKQDDPQVTAACEGDDVPADLRLPADNATIKLNVFNATDKPGLASQVANAFRSHRFTVVKEANDPAAKQVNEVAHLRFGPKMVGAAWVVRAYFLNTAKLEFDINRKDLPETTEVDERDVIDVVLGPQYKQLGTTTEKNQSIGQAGYPTLPPGTCDANAG